jgi:Zn-dependent membrane protease YugP
MGNYVIQNILLLLAILIPIMASIKLRSTYSKFKQVKNSKDLTGFDVARQILDANGMKDMYIVETAGNLTDHYDPKGKVVRLSKDIFHGNSIASLAVAAHECGHAIQDKEGYLWLKIRSAIFPIVSLVTKVAYVIFFVSLILQYIGALYFALVLVLFGLAFQIVTLPVEFNASARALNKISEYGLVTEDEKPGAKKVLTAAAMTYVAGVLSEILDLVRILISINNRRR